MKLSSAIFLVVAFALFFVDGRVEAQSRASLQAPWEKGCRAYSSDSEFISSASVYCLKQQNQRVCHRQAAQEFSRCGFSSDYVKMSRKMYAKMLVVWALASAQKGSASGHS